MRSNSKVALILFCTLFLSHYSCQALSSPFKVVTESDSVKAFEGSCLPDSIEGKIEGKRNAFFYKVLAYIGSWQEASAEPWGVIGSAGIRIKHDMPISDINDIDLLMGSEQSANNLIDFLFERIRHDIYRAWGDEHVTVEKGHVRKDESKAAVSTRMGLITFFYQSVPIASIEISVADKWMGEREFTNKKLMLPADVLFNGKGDFSIPVLSDTSYVTLDLHTLNEDIKNLDSLFNQPQNSAIDSMLYSCQSLFKVNKRIPFYRQVTQGHQDRYDLMMALCESFNSLLFGLKTQEELLPTIQQRARLLEYGAIRQHAPVLPEGERVEPSGHSFEELQVILRKELSLSRIKGDGNCFYQTVAEILNDDSRMRSRFILAEKTLLKKYGERALEEKITQKDVRVLIHHWLAKAAAVLSPENASRLNTLILVEGFSLSEALAKKIIFDSAVSCEDVSRFGWSNLLNVVSFVTGFNFAVVVPDSVREEIDVCPYGNRAHDPLYCDLAQLLSHVKGLVFDAEHEPLVGNMKFMVYSGSDHYCKAEPNFLLSKRLKLLNEAEKVCVSFQEIKIDDLFKGSLVAKESDGVKGDSIAFDRSLFNVPPFDDGQCDNMIGVAQPFVFSRDEVGASDKRINSAPVSTNHSQPSPKKKKKKKKKRRNNKEKISESADQLNVKSEAIVDQTQGKHVCFSCVESEVKCYVRSRTQGISDDKRKPVKIEKPLPLGYQQLNKVINLVEMKLCKGGVSGDFKIKLREKLLNALIPLLSTNHDNTISAADFIEVDFDHIDRILFKGLELGDKLDDPIAPVVLGMQQLLALDPLSVDSKRLWKAIRFFVSAAQRGNIQGAFNLYWLAALTGSAEALGMSFAVMKYLDDKPKEKLKTIIYKISSSRFLVNEIAESIIMPAVVKLLSTSSAPERFDAAHKVLENAYPKNEILKFLLTPDVLFDGTGNSYLDKEHFSSSLAHFAHEGSAYLQRGQQVTAVDYFMPAAIGYALLVKNRGIVPISGMVRASGLYATYQCLNFFDGYHSSGGQNVVPVSIKQWQDCFGAISKALSSVSPEHDLCQIISKGRLASTPVALSESRVEYIKNRSKANIELSTLEDIDRDIKARSACLQGEGELIVSEGATEEIATDNTSAAVDVDLGKGHKPLQLVALNRKVADVSRRKNLAAASEALKELGSVIKDLQKRAWTMYYKFKYAPEYARVSKKELSTAFFDDVYANVETISRILRKDVAYIAETVKLSRTHCETLEKEIYDLTLTCCMSFSQLVGISDSQDLDISITENIEYLQRNLMTEDRINTFFSNRDKDFLIRELYNDFRENAVLLLNPELYKSFNRALCGSLFNSFFIYSKIFCHHQFDEKQKSILLSLFERVLSYFNHYNDMSALLYAMAISGIDFNDGRCLALLATALDKYWLSITTSVEVDDQEKHFNYMNEYVSGLAFDGKQEILSIWHREYDEYKMEMTSILKSRKAYARLVWDDLVQDETQRKKKKKKKKKAIKLVQASFTDESAGYQSDEPDNEGDPSGCITYEINDAPLPEVVAVSTDDAFHEVYKWAKKKEFDKAIGALDTLANKSNGDLLTLARVRVLKAECLFYKLKKEYPIFNDLKKCCELLCKYKEQYQSASESLRLPKVTKEQLKDGCALVSRIVAGMNEDDHYLRQAIHLQNEAVKILKQFSGEQEELKSELALLFPQYDRFKNILKQGLSMCSDMRDALKYRSVLMEKIGRKREKESVSAGWGVYSYQPSAVPPRFQKKAGEACFERRHQKAFTKPIQPDSGEDSLNVNQLQKSIDASGEELERLYQELESVDELGYLNPASCSG